MAKNVVTTPYGIAELRTDGILMVQANPGLQGTLEVAQAHLEVGRQLIGDRAPVPMLIIYGGIKHQTREARDYLANHPDLPQIVTCIGIVIDSYVSRVLANLIIGLYQVRVPIKLFNSEAEAVPWLLRTSTQQRAERERSQSLPPS